MNLQTMPPRSLPIIDLATYRAGAPDAKARLIAAVSRELGFFYLVNHGLSDAFLADQLELWAALLRPADRREAGGGFLGLARAARR
jgi:hypothetical protein